MRKSSEVTGEALDAALATVLEHKGAEDPVIDTLTENWSPFQTAGPAFAAPPSFEVKRSFGATESDDDDDDEEEEGSAIDFGSALEAALAALGYTSEAARDKLNNVLSAAASGAPFPEDIRSSVATMTGASPEVVDAGLQRQAKPVLTALQASMDYVIRRKEELEESGDDDDEADIQERLRLMGPCPMGFEWHRVAGGWRCGGGTHHVADDDPLLFMD